MVWGLSMGASSVSAGGRTGSLRRAYAARRDVVTGAVTTTAVRQLEGVRPNRLDAAAGCTPVAVRGNRRPPFPAWLRAIDRVHRSQFTADVVALDAAVVLLVSTFVAASTAVVLGVAAAVPFALTVGGGYRSRCTLETQGVNWFAKAMLAPVAAVAVVAAAVSHGGSADAVRFVIASGIALLALRAATWAVICNARRAGWGLRRTVVVGKGEAVRVVARKLHEYREAGLVPVGIVASDGDVEEGAGLGLGALPADLPAILVHGDVTNVVLVPEGNDDADLTRCLDRCDGLDVDFALLPPLSELYLRPTLVAQVGGLPLIPLGRAARTARALPAKRLFDLLGASLLLLISAPVMLATALAIRLDDGGPVLYRQRRVGRGGRVFGMLKFRSMVVGADRLVIDLRDQNVTDGLLFKVADDPRVTRVGRYIRRLSIDELPQLLNVLRGEMSLVGPRPLPVEPDAFGALDGKRHSVPPGITGYWQIAGGNDLTYAEMVKLDLSYVQNWSLWLDVLLLCRTLPALVHRRGPA
jgi:exopolysaccharide biosynthesis polyprenyl glycosylphosphotransferase